MLADECLELSHQLPVSTELEVSGDPLLEPREAEVVEPPDLVLRERVVREVGEGRPAPERERLPQQRRRLLAALRRQCIAAPREQDLELLDVDRPRLEREP